MRAAIYLDALTKKLKAAKVSAALITEVEALYAMAYREAYGDGKSDCEEKQQDKETEE